MGIQSCKYWRSGPGSKTSQWLTRAAYLITWRPGVSLNSIGLFDYLHVHSGNWAPLWVLYKEYTYYIRVKVKVTCRCSHYFASNQCRPCRHRYRAPFLIYHEILPLACRARHREQSGSLQDYRSNGKGAFVLPSHFQYNALSLVWCGSESDMML